MKTEFKGFDVLVREMAAATTVLDGLPEDHEFTQESLLLIDDIRGAALRLAEMSETVIKEFQSGKPQ